MISVTKIAYSSKRNTFHLENAYAQLMPRAYATAYAGAYATNAVVRAPGKETEYSVTEGAGAAASPEGDQLRSLATDRFTLSAAPRGAESRLWNLRGVVACGEGRTNTP